jgi:hypothetical protein
MHTAFELALALALGLVLALVLAPQRALFTLTHAARDCYEAYS